MKTCTQCGFEEYNEYMDGSVCKDCSFTEDQIKDALLRMKAFEAAEAMKYQGFRPEFAWKHRAEIFGFDQAWTEAYGVLRGLR